jgi:predicted CXXCH cytochrome family protein
MIVDKQGPLCFSCHDDLDKGIKGGKSTHAPVVSAQCTECHSPHKAKLDRLLLAKSPDLCQSCHKDLKAKMEREKAHSPALRDCQRCHIPHFSAEPSLIVQPIHALCGGCHSLED